MNRFLAGSVLALTLVGAGLASAATSPARPIDYGARCKTLAGQWSSTSPAHATSQHFSLAKADAVRGEKSCASSNAAQQKKGTSAYRAALKLIGVTPSL